MLYSGPQLPDLPGSASFSLRSLGDEGDFCHRLIGYTGGRMRLLWGPPGAGKTHTVMAEVRHLLAAGANDFRLLVPTATMAEHLGHQLAREGFAFPPELVSTLTRFLAACGPDLHQVPATALPLVVETALARRTPPAFAKVAGFPGFAGSLARLMEEFDSAGCGVERLSALVARLAPGGDIVEEAFLETWREVQAELNRREWLLRGEMLRRQAGMLRAGGVPGIGRIFFDGFLSMTGPELEVLASLAAHVPVDITLPAWSGAETARETLLGYGFQETRLVERRRVVPSELVVEARSISEEAGEVARRILAEHSTGRPWREMGVILRREGVYLTALRTAFSRFGIPARFYFSVRAADHELVRYLTAVVESMLAGWDHELLIGALSTPLSGVGATPEGDRLEFTLREELPAQGLKALRGTPLFVPLSRLDTWGSGRRKPAEWAADAAVFRALVLPPRLAEPLTQEAVLAARSAATALEAFEGALEGAAQLMEAGAEVSFSEFWRNVRASLRLTEVRIADRRRDVVHVIDVYEARQWELPVVFVCGLLEKEFPRYHSEEPVFGDAARVRLARAGVPVRTSEERQREERFLFDIAVSRATSLSVLTWPRYNEKGDENLRSFVLDEFARRPGVSIESARPVRPAPRGELRPAPAAPIHDLELRALIARKHAALAVTAIESFLQCPFQFFARQTLELDAAPRRPEERLDTLLRGRILHAVLADLSRHGQADLAAAFRRFCDRERVPEGFRREAAFLELKRNLETFLAGSGLPRDWQTEVERAFELPAGEVTLRGRIDRVDVDPATSRAIVVDYKYSSPEAIHKNVKAHEEGRLVQGGLYLAAVERVLGLKPAAMVYCGLKREPACEGWRCDVPELPATVENCAPDVLREVIDQALARAEESVAKIRSGEIAATPADPDKCEFCDFADICRVESAPARVLAAGEAAE